MINPYLLDAFGARERRRGFVVPLRYVPVLQGDGRTLELRKRFDRKSDAEKWAIRVRARLMVRYDSQYKEPTA